MALLPDNTGTTKYKLDQIRHPSRRGRTVAMSTIGHSCERHLWFSFHWAGPVEPITARLMNLFETGTRAEDFMVEDLKRIGIEITDRQEELWGFAKHAHGFTDGRAHNVPEAPKTPHLVEFKTHNDKNFQKLQKEKVKVGFPKHYAQVQRYMKGTKLTRTLYIGYNKNTSAYYVERLRYDASFANDLVRKEREIILNPNAPTKKFMRTWFECKWCDHFGVCHDGAALDENCRTCKFVDLCEDGKWECAHQGDEGESFEIPIEVQETGCHLYEVMTIDDDKS